MERSELLKNFFRFLRMGLWGRQEFGEEVSFSASQWKQLFALAHRQAVTGVLVDGVALGTSKPDDEVWGKWIAHLFHLEKANGWIAQRGNQWISQLAEAGISASVFKGSSVSGWYPQPLHRSYGDIDVVVTGGWEKLPDFLHEMGMVSERMDEDEIIVCEKNGVYVEFHRLWECLYHRKNNARLQELCRNDWCEEMYFVCLILHVQRHFLTYGIGLKQVCDVAVMLYATQLDYRKIAAILKELQMETFSRLLFGFISLHLCPVKDYPLPPITHGKKLEMLSEVIWQEGYELKMKQEVRSESRGGSFTRMADNACFWAKRCLRLCSILPGEAGCFLLYKARKRLNIN